VGALVIDGLTHREIGARLYISPKTVEQHVARLRQKLAASNRATLVAGLRACLED
jgi:DNA-binding CsgD family transcriptional regulator